MLSLNAPQFVRIYLINYRLTPLVHISSSIQTITLLAQVLI